MLELEKDALVLLRKARHMMQLAKETAPSRELSIAMTECESAILWLHHDMCCKVPSTQGAAL